jgi:hypothetical protein
LEQARQWNDAHTDGVIDLTLLSGAVVGFERLGHSAGAVRRLLRRTPGGKR